MNNDFSDFFHNATPEEKKRVMLEVMKEASEDQRKMIEGASSEHVFDNDKEGCIKCGGFANEPCEPPVKFTNLDDYGMKTRDQLIGEIVHSWKELFACCDGKNRHATCQCYRELKCLRQALIRVSEASMDAVEVEEKPFHPVNHITQEDMFNGGHNSAIAASKDKRKEWTGGR